MPLTHDPRTYRFDAMYPAQRTFFSGANIGFRLRTADEADVLRDGGRIIVTVRGAACLRGGEKPTEPEAAGPSSRTDPAGRFGALFGHQRN